MKFRRFTKRQVLKKIGRELLHKFFASFAEDLKANHVPLPTPELAGDEYFHCLAAALMSPEALPDRLNEALFAIDEMANPEGRERLERAVAESGLDLSFGAESSHEEVALQVWLAAPALLARKHNEQRLRRLEAFEYACARPNGEAAPPLVAPDPAQLEGLAASLDSWFARHQRGEQTTRIECYPLAGDFWFLVRHGDTFTRAPKVDKQKTEVIHFRPEKDDVIVYSPTHDLLRINARTKGERDLYLEQFGLVLRGDPGYFSVRKTYTLEPLRTNGADALAADGIAGINKITLRALEVAWDNGFHEVITREADDLFESAWVAEGLVPSGGRLTRAVLDFHFADSARPRPVEIRPPNILKLGRHCDAQLVEQWLWKRGFRIDQGNGASRT